MGSGSNFFVALAVSSIPVIEHGQVEDRIRDAATTERSM
jgi:hypothetical protein